MANKEGKCKFCDNICVLVKSHIIPKGLYWGLVDRNGKIATELSPNIGEYPARKPAGYYDYFLCDEHEKQFNDWDTYACSLLRDTSPAKIESGFLFKEVIYSSIKLFFISLIWRAHCAEIPFFNRVRLGAHATRMKELITDRKPCSSDEYSIVLWRSDELMAKTVVEPFVKRYENVLFYHFYLPGYKVLIKVDKRPLPDRFQAYSLNASGTWVAGDWNFKGSGEEQMMLRVAKRYLKTRKNQ